ncbi:MAG: hypothetical protein OXU72_03615, partial [Gammaproteobacteria bacterium]|nr:hypothetical protein [Gammaproteobacteria bacterium]
MIRWALRLSRYTVPGALLAVALGCQPAGVEDAPAQVGDLSPVTGNASLDKAMVPAEAYRRAERFLLANAQQYV